MCWLARPFPGLNVLKKILLTRGNLLTVAILVHVCLVSSAGSLNAGSTDVMSDGRGGYTLVLLQNLCTAMSLALSKESALTPHQLVILNSIAGAVCCSLLGFAFERDEVLEFPHFNDPRFVSGMVIMCTCST